MNKTSIKLNGKNIDILFGAWSVGQLIKSGIKFENMQDEIYDHLATIVYLGACNAAGRDLNAYDVEDFHAAPFGLLIPVLATFNKSMSQDVPVEKKSTARVTK